MKRAIIILLFFFLETEAQDLHFSQFTKNPFLLNPALIGNFEEDYSFNAQKRTQWSSVTVPFNTFSASFEASEMLNRYSTGVQFLHDISGDAKLSTIGANISFSRKFLFDKKNQISLGIMTGFVQRKIDYSNLIFLENEYLPSMSNKYIDLSLGGLFTNTSKTSNKKEIGISVYHINKPNQSLLKKDDLIPVRFNIHTSFFYKIKSRMRLIPSIYYSVQDKQKETVLGTVLIYKMIDIIDEPVEIKTSLYNRFNDAVILGFGILYQKAEVIFSYDINTSSFTPATDYRGGFEFTFIYKWQKKKQNKKLKKCPTYL